MYGKQSRLASKLLANNFYCWFSGHTSVGLRLLQAGILKWQYLNFQNFLYFNDTISISSINEKSLQFQNILKDDKRVISRKLRNRRFIFYYWKLMRALKNDDFDSNPWFTVTLVVSCTSSAIWMTPYLREGQISIT